MSESRASVQLEVGKSIMVHFFMTAGCSWVLNVRG